MNPMILTDNRFADGVITATNTAMGFSPLHLADMREFTLHKSADASDHFITVDCGVPKAADAIGIAAHNLIDVGASVAVECSSDNFVSDITSALASTFVMSSGPFFAMFPTQTKQYWRLVVTGLSDSFYVAIVTIGEVLKFDEPLIGDYTPQVIEPTAQTAISATGNLLGVVTGVVQQHSTWTFERLSDSWVRNNFEPVWESHLKQGLSVFCIPTYLDNPTDIFLFNLQIDKGLDVPLMKAGRRRLVLDWRGVYVPIKVLAAVPLGDFVETGSLLAADAGSGDSFGWSVALNESGSVLCVGATYWDGGLSNMGGVYVYDEVGSGYVQRGSVLTAGDYGNADHFGGAVALSGDGLTLIVGVRDWDLTGFSGAGGVYTLDWIDSNWVQRGDVLSASPPVVGDAFGSSVALSSDGNTLVVGVEYYGNYEGAVYTFDRSGNSWVQRGIVLNPIDASVDDYFGSAVALSANADVLVVGARRHRGATNGSDAGAVYTFVRSGDFWVQRGGLLYNYSAEVNGNKGEFGSSVALNDDASFLAVGAILWPYYSSPSKRGGVFVFNLSGDDWVGQQSPFNAADSGSLDAFGRGVALNGSSSTLLVGARSWDGVSVNQGNVYRFDR